ncbi:MAG: SPOR domain-containing protein [Prevotella sp.]|jgi:cell division protein FtsN|nr:SPOR domain-containing protein [Prevotella sp.]
MKKYMLLCAGLCAAMALTSCKSSESAYKKAYEKAKAQEAEQPANQPIQSDSTPVVTPLQTKSADQTTVMDNADNAAVRKENVTVVSGEGLKNFSVVVGSFSLKANAEGLQNTLKNAGYQAQIAYNSSRNMYRVIASTFDSKLSAVQSRNQFRADNYPDAWLLYKE